MAIAKLRAIATFVRYLQIKLAQTGWLSKPNFISHLSMTLEAL
jgi:hypothetical protein